MDEPSSDAYGKSSPFASARERPALARAMPLSGHLRSYRGRAARGDLLAGRTVAALAMPAGIAYAELTGLSPVVGL